MSNTINNGGPAFPTENARQTGPSSWHEEGMTLRDYFAAKAMQSYVSRDSWIPAELEKTKESYDQLLARYAYEMADAMLRAREAT